LKLQKQKSRLKVHFEPGKGNYIFDCFQPTKFFCPRPAFGSSIQAGFSLRLPGAELRRG